MAHNSIRIYINNKVYIALALAILLLPLKWLLSAILAAGFHELCHFFALRLGRVEVRCIRIGVGGAAISTGTMTALQELLCALAGPAGGAVLALAAPLLPTVALCALVQTAFNLLPIFPLDGGRALRALSQLLLPPRAAQRVCLLAWICCAAALSILVLYLSLQQRFGLWPFALLLPICGKKDLANYCSQRYNRANTM